MKKLVFILLVGWLSATSAIGQTFPNEVFDPYGVPTIEGARVLKTKIDKEKGWYCVAYDAAFEQVSKWIDDMVAKGMIIGNKDKRELDEDRARKNHSSEMELHFPLGTYGNQQEMYVFLDYGFVYPTEFLFPRSVGASVAIGIMSIYDEDAIKPKLEAPQADILSPFGITDVSGFVPKHSLQFFAKTVKSDKALHANLPVGTPVIGTLEARFTHGYVPTFAEVDRWAKAIYKACAANASSIDPLGSSSEIATSHWWTYTYKGVKYQASVSADLDHLGRFEFAIMRLN